MDNFKSNSQKNKIKKEWADLNKELDKHNFARGLLTDLSKAFDCINHELMIGKLEAYGFDHKSLETILSYLSNRKHRTKINNCYS